MLRNFPLFYTYLSFMLVHISSAYAVSPEQFTRYEDITKEVPLEAVENGNFSHLQQTQRVEDRQHGAYRVDNVWYDRSSNVIHGESGLEGKILQAASRQHIAGTYSDMQPEERVANTAGLVDEAAHDDWSPQGLEYLQMLHMLEEEICQGPKLGQDSRPTAANHDECSTVTLDAFDCRAAQPSSPKTASIIESTSQSKSFIKRKRAGIEPLWYKEKNIHKKGFVIKRMSKLYSPTGTALKNDQMRARYNIISRFTEQDFDLAAYLYTPDSILQEIANRTKSSTHNKHCAN